MCAYASLIVHVSDVYACVCIYTYIYICICVYMYTVLYVFEYLFIHMTGCKARVIHSAWAKSCLPFTQEPETWH